MDIKMNISGECQVNVSNVAILSLSFSFCGSNIHVNILEVIYMEIYICQNVHDLLT